MGSFVYYMVGLSCFLKALLKVIKLVIFSRFKQKMTTFGVQGRWVKMTSCRGKPTPQAGYDHKVKKVLTCLSLHKHWMHLNDFLQNKLAYWGPSKKTVYAPAIEKLQLIGLNLGLVFSTRSGCMHLLCSVAKLPNLRLKTCHKQHVGYLLLVFALPLLNDFNR